MENTESHNTIDDKPIGMPKVEQPTQPPKTWKTMPTWKKVLVIGFSIVCAFGLYDTFFPSKNSLKMEELLPRVITPTPTVQPSLTPTPTPPKSS